MTCSFVYDSSECTRDVRLNLLTCVEYAWMEPGWSPNGPRMAAEWNPNGTCIAPVQHRNAPGWHPNALGWPLLASKCHLNGAETLRQNTGFGVKNRLSAVCLTFYATSSAQYGTPCTKSSLGHELSRVWKHLKAKSSSVIDPYIQALEFTYRF